MCTNSEKYQRLNFIDLLRKYDKIIIPMLQRDYAQGRKDDKKAIDVRTNLLGDVFSDKHEINFDLVFGSQENREGQIVFIPVDGQQRLTTLFLLYLYNAKINTYITDGLSKFTYETRRAAADFCKAIVEKDWSVPDGKGISEALKDNIWFMQYWNNDPTVISMLQMLDDIQERAPKGNFIDKLDRISFYFFDLEQNGLNETLYLKMNSRGKPLTAFENLKASIDSMLPTEADYHFEEMGNDVSGNNFKDKWRYCIDRKWIETFWNKDNPTNLDKNMTQFIVRFLSGCYAAFSQKDNKMTKDISEHLKNINADDDNYSSFIQFPPIKTVLELDGAFSLLAYAFSVLSCKEKVLHPYWDQDTPFKVDKKSDYIIIAVLFAYVLFKGNEEAVIFAWNMAENTVVDYDSFISLCRRFREIKDDDNFKKGIYYALVNHNFYNPSEQLEEEIEKAKQIIDEDELRMYVGNIKEFKNKSWKEVIFRAEKYSFFKGAIRFLIRDENGEWDWRDFDKKWNHAQKFFTVGGVYQNNSLLLRYFISKFTDWSLFWGMTFDNADNSWRTVLLDNKWRASIHELLIGDHIEIKTDYRASLMDLEPLYENVQKKVQEDLVITKLLEHIEKGCHLYWRYDNYALYPSNTRNKRNKYIIGNNRNRILSSLYGGESSEKEKCPKKIYTDQKIEDCDCFWGWDINFKYLDKNFQWYRTDFIYLMDDSDPNHYLIKDKFETEETKRYFCFNTKDLATDEIVKNLDQLKSDYESSGSSD